MFYTQALRFIEDLQKLARQCQERFALVSGSQLSVESFSAPATPRGSADLLEDTRFVLAVLAVFMLLAAVGGKNGALTIPAHTGCRCWAVHGLIRKEHRRLCDQGASRWTASRN